ncbi:proteasome inhibitor PI31 subunit [Culex quinquefasciatus]|uniref:proteasome inhibitor PI31 subunit n=1 Tax=Culex quinquefasciatus TaxID=7176 RepID=UPI0018E383BB|nr:proteasome inhibitor PI31 subunit [Culex quinquefasciatus]
MSSADYYGFESIYKLVEAAVQAKSDVLIAIIHWYLTKNAFRNVGIGDDKTLSDSEEQSELLPDGWNSNPKSYALRYVNDGQLYLLHGVDTGGLMVVNLVQVKSLSASNVTFQIDETVKSLKGSITKLIPEVATVLDRVRKELLVPVFESNKKDGETQTKKEPEKVERVDVRPANPLLIGGGVPVGRFGSDPLGVGNVGRGDLDPFGRGGGMLFQPPGGFNPLADLRRPGGSGIVPGARFDPFGPGVGQNPRPFRQPGPDPDHLPPPGYDDMFM